MQQFYRNGKTIEWDSENPVITCLMSVYNGEMYLREAMDSILDQTYTNFEFLIINDGSTDSSVSIIESYDDPRIRLIHNQENIGLTKSLNKGIDFAKGEYIARMDADDVSMKERFERQLVYLTKNTTKDFTATTLYKNIEEIDQIKIVLIFINPILHSSVFAKKIIFREKYNQLFETAQDYELWTRVVEKYNISIFKDGLVKLGNSINRVSTNKREQQISNHKTIVLKYLNNFEIIISEIEVEYLIRSSLNCEPVNQFLVHQLKMIFDSIMYQNCKSRNPINEKYFKKYFLKLWFRLIPRIQENRLAVLKFYIKNQLILSL